METCHCPSNSTTSMPSELLLLGLSWIQRHGRWMSIPFTVIYSVAFLGNCTLVLIISSERSLHKPMYIYISVLALVDLALSGSVIPKILGILWFDLHTINAEACLVQMYVIFCNVGLESSLFMLMSYDRYVAICHPLRYSSIMTNSFTIKSVVFIVIWTLSLLSPLPYLTTRLAYCKSNIVLHAFCDHLSIVKLACGDMTPNNVYMYSVFFLFSVADNTMIGLSYLLILRAVLRLGSSEARKKAFSTCSAHIIVKLFFVFSATISFLLYLFNAHVPEYLQCMPSILNCLVPPMVNPIVYGVKMKEIRESLKKFLKNIETPVCMDTEYCKKNGKCNINLFL